MESKIDKRVLIMHRKINSFSQQDMEISHYCEIENGTINPTLETLEKICKKLKITIIDILGVKYMNNINNNRLEIMNKFQEGNIDYMFKGGVTSLYDKSIWYDETVALIKFDEVEITIYTAGNVRYQYYKDGNKVLDENSCDAGKSLMQYFHSDEQLERVIREEEVSYSVIQEEEEVVFLLSSNSFILKAKNLETGQIIESTLDFDKITECFQDIESLFDWLYNDCDE